ncbi:MAG: MFS transporter [Patescibacteria group bacterium]
MDNFLKKIYLYSFLNGFNLIFPIFTLLFSKHGLNTVEISLLIAIWSVTTIVFEVPAGVLADKYSRRNLLALANCLRGIGFIFWLIGGSFFMYAIGFVLWGLRNVLTSGTLEAFIYDELKSEHQEHLYEKASGRLNGHRFLGWALSAVLGGIIAQYSFPLAILGSIATSFLSACVLLFIRDVKQTRSTEETQYFQILKNAFLQAKSNTYFLLIVAFICIIFGVYGATDEYWALIFHDFGLMVSSIGFITAIIYGLTSLAGYSAHIFRNLRWKNVELILLSISGLLFMATGLSKTIVLLPLLFLGIYLIRVAEIQLEAKMQHHIRSHERATMTSMKSLVFELVYVAIILLYGFTARMFGIVSLVTVSGIVFIVSPVIYYLFSKKFYLSLHNTGSVNQI